MIPCGDKFTALDIKGKEVKVKDELSGEMMTAKFTIGVSTSDCLGCGLCEGICPTKALVMGANHTSETAAVQKHFDYLFGLPDRSSAVYNPIEIERKSIESQSLVPVPPLKDLQFRQPLFEFSAACTGCTEAPIVRVITQMLGERMMIANACGCSMVWGGYSPACPYTLNGEGRGPSYTGSLFEDTAEFAYGIATGGQLLRQQLFNFVEKGKDLVVKKESTKEKAMIGSAEWKAACENWLKSFDHAQGSGEYGKEIVSMMKNSGVDSGCGKGDGCCISRDIWNLRDHLQKKSYWCFGGDGWAYDIGFGGLDQVLHMGAKLNILVMDTEVYSNTGGQKSKSTPRGAIAKFAAAGKPTSKKDLGLYAMNLGCCYVATVSQGANPAQMIRALHEAEQFPGTSIVIAFCPCINWGMKGGQTQSIAEQKLAVECGYWPLYRYNPLLKKEGKNPLTIDSAPPKKQVSELLAGESRFSALHLLKPDAAKELHETLQCDVEERLKKLYMLHQGSEAGKKA
jgi:pyruvate-ferredoxin/flavodoxin oxidoreductase